MPLSTGAEALSQSNNPAYPAFKTASGFSRTVQTLTGVTQLSSWVANRLIRKALRQNIAGELHSQLSLFSGTDLLAGKAKRFTLSGHNVLLDGFIPLSEFQFQNEPDQPFFVKKGRRPTLLRPVQFKASAVMSEADINAMLRSEKGRKLLTAMKVKLPPFGAQYMDIIAPSVTLSGERVNIQARMNMHEAPPENALPIQLSGRIQAEKSTLALSDLHLQIEGLDNTEDIAQLIEHYFSELVNLNHLKVERHRVKVAILQSDMKDHRLHLEARVTVQPDRKALEKALRPNKK